MSAARTVWGARRDARGFGMPELLVSVVMGGIVLASVYKLMISQGRAYGKERELMDVRRRRAARRPCSRGSCGARRLAGARSPP